MTRNRKASSARHCECMRAYLLPACSASPALTCVRASVGWSRGSGRVDIRLRAAACSCWCGQECKGSPLRCHARGEVDATSVAGHCDVPVQSEVAFQTSITLDLQGRNKQNEKNNEGRIVRREQRSHQTLQRRAATEAASKRSSAVSFPFPACPIPSHCYAHHDMVSAWLQGIEIAGHIW